MKIEVGYFISHLGEHDFGIPNMESEDSKLDKPVRTDRRRRSYSPNFRFCATNQIDAENFIKRLNWLAAKYHINASDLGDLVNIVDRLF